MSISAPQFQVDHIKVSYQGNGGTADGGPAGWTLTESGLSATGEGLVSMEYTLDAAIAHYQELGKVIATIQSLTPKASPLPPMPAGQGPASAEDHASILASLTGAAQDISGNLEDFAIDAVVSTTVDSIFSALSGSGKAT